MAKKFTLTLLLLCIIGSSSIWAWDYPEAQGTLVGTGIGLLLLPMVMDSEDPDANATAYTVGAIFIGVGVLWMILDISLTADAGQNPDGIYLASGKTESISVPDILRHVFVGCAKDKFSLGFWYSY